MAESLTNRIPQNIETEIDSLVSLINKALADKIPVRKGNTRALHSMLQIMASECEYGVDAIFKIEDEPIRYNLLKKIAVSARTDVISEKALNHITHMPENSLCAGDNPNRRLFQIGLDLHKRYLKPQALLRIAKEAQSEKIKDKAFNLILEMKSEGLRSGVLTDLFYNNRAPEDCVKAVVDFKDEKVRAVTLTEMFNQYWFKSNPDNRREEKRSMLLPHLPLFREQLIRQQGKIHDVIRWNHDYAAASRAYIVFKDFNLEGAIRYTAEHAKNSQLKQEAVQDLYTLNSCKKIAA